MHARRVFWIVVACTLASPICFGQDDSGAEKKKSKAWHDIIQLKGDFRYRHESCDAENKDPRHRHRIRGRIGLTAEPHDWVKVCIRLATGGDDPVSTNQSLGDFFTTKGIRLDLAYAELEPRGLLEGLRLFAGKMKHPVIKVQKSSLLWDGDLNPEGVAGTWKRAFGSLEVTATAGAFWILEQKADVDPALWAAQLAFKFTLSKATHFLGGASLFAYPNIRGAEVFYVSDDCFGNGATADGNGDLHYDADFQVAEIFAELQTRADDITLVVYGDVAINTGTDDDRFGWLVGINAKAWGFTAGYDYRRLEKDCTVGAFADSDHAGGGTDGQGHRFRLKYSFTKKIALAVTYFLDEQGLDTRTAYHRVQADLALKF